MMSCQDQQLSEPPLKRAKTGERLGSAKRTAPDEHLLSNWSSLGENQSTTLHEQRPGQFPSWSPLGGNLFLRHEESSDSSRGSSFSGNHQTNFITQKRGWQVTVSQGNYRGSRPNISLNTAKQEEVGDLNFSRSHGIGRLDNRAVFEREEELATAAPGKVGSPSYDRCGGRVDATSLRESDKMKNLRQHLLILLHAHKCQSKLDTGVLDECKMPYCATMRSLLEHMKSCRVAGQWQCPVQHCTSSSKILTHWKSCKKQFCHLCSPIRQPHMPKSGSLSLSTSPQHFDGKSGVSPHLQQQQDTPGLHQQFSLIARQPYLNSPQTNSGEKGQDQSWRNSISSELRAHLVDKMLLVLKTSSHQPQTQESVQNLLMVAKEVELETHGEARSSGEYFQLMSQKTATMSIGGWRHRDSFSIEPVSDVAGTGVGEARSTTEAAEENILPSKSPRVKQGSSVEKGNTDLRPLARQSMARKEPRGTGRSPSAIKFSEGGISEVGKAQEVTGRLETKVRLSPTDLRTALLPTLEKLYSQEPESEPFRSPVDPVALGIEDYFEVVKKPMDLSRIRRKLEVGSYQDPWQFIGDVYLMLENAWLYNKKNSRVYKFTSKLADVFEEEIDPVMRDMGFCCGRKLHYNPQSLCCYGSQLCTIPKDGNYFYWENRGTGPSQFYGEYTLCEKCMESMEGEVLIGDDPNQPQMKVQKEEFNYATNNRVEKEEMVECEDCGRKFHQVCVLHLQNISGSKFHCSNCADSKPAHRFTAKNLPTTRLSNFIEVRVENFLKREHSGTAEKVHVRVVFVGEKKVEVKPEMKQKFVDKGLMENNFPFKARAIFAFQEQDGADVCFFGLHVQEYSDNCPPPNSRRLYVAYLDSVHFFQPRQYRTAVYHEILLGYMDYMSKLGFTWAHIWACPPGEGDDYIFHQHPVDQKIPKPKRLQEWYRNLLEKGVAEKIVRSYRDIHKQAIKDKVQSPAELPYFDGDFWPNILEDTIKGMGHETAAQGINNVEDAKSPRVSLRPPGPPGPSVTTQDSSPSGSGKNIRMKKPRKLGSKKSQGEGEDLMSQVMVLLERHKDVFFTVRLHNPKSTAGGTTDDPDPLMQVQGDKCDLMDGRDAFLTMCRDRHLEFSTLRRAKFSTLTMLYELQTQDQDKFEYNCNHCSKWVETRYHCTVCEDFDLCVSCYRRNGHQHMMKMIEGGTLDGPATSAGQALRRQNIERCIENLEHACSCKATACTLANCEKMRRVVTHYRVCKQKDSGSCGVCKQLLALCCYHAKQCKAVTCLVPFCHGIRQTLQQRRIQKNASMQRRVAQMRATLDTASNNLTNDNRQCSKVRFESKGVQFKAHEMGSESIGHLKESNQWKRGNQLQQSMLRQGEKPVLQGKVEEDEPKSNGMITKSFLQLLQASGSPQDQRRQVLGVFQSNPKLLDDYLKSRESRNLSAPVQNRDLQGQQGFKVLPLPWKDEGVRSPNSSIMQQQQMRSQQPVWFQQQQQLVGGKLKLLPASLVKQQEGVEQPKLLPAALHAVGGVQFEVNQ